MVFKSRDFQFAIIETITLNVNVLSCSFTLWKTERFKWNVKMHFTLVKTFPSKNKKKKLLVIPQKDFDEIVFASDQSICFRCEYF